MERTDIELLQDHVHAAAQLYCGAMDLQGCVDASEELGISPYQFDRLELCIVIADPMVHQS